MRRRMRAGVMVIAALCLVPLGCDDDETSDGPLIPTASQLAGHWRVVRYVESEVEQEGSARYTWDTTATVTDSSFFYDFSANYLVWLSNKANCYDNSWKDWYGLVADGTLYGETWTGADTGAECIYTWRTSVSMDGSQLVVTYREAETCPTGYSYVYTYTDYCVPYTGAWLPESWPVDTCIYLPKAQVPDRLHRGKRQ